MNWRKPPQHFAELRRASNTPRGQCHPRLSGGNHFARNGKVRPRGVFAASDKSLPRSRKTPFDLGCSRDTSRGCVGRRCTVLSYTFRSHPYQNTVERGCCSKVFFGLRNNDAWPFSEQAIHPEGNAIFGYDGGNHFCKKGRSVRGVSLLRAPTTANKTQRPTVTENKMAFCKKWKQMADRNGTPLASGGRGNWTWRSPP